MCPGSRPCAFSGGPALAAAAVVLLLSTTVAAGACVRGGPDLANLNDDQMHAAEAGSLLELNNDTLAARLEAASSAQRYILFTTTSAWKPELLNMTRNWFAHVQRCAAILRVKSGSTSGSVHRQIELGTNLCRSTCFLRDAQAATFKDLKA
jgi:hypothetical protein